MKLYFIDLEKVEDGKIYIDFGDGFYKSYNVEDLRDGILLEDDQDYSKIKLKFNNKVVQNVEVHKSINIKDIYSDVIIKDLIYNRADKDHEHDGVYYTESEIDEKLASKADVDLSNVTGVLPPTKGGTGKTSLKDSANALLNGLDTGASVPSDEDYYISQYVNGGTTTTTYHRRPVKALWEYIKTKISSVLGLTASQYNGNADSATNDSLGNPISTTYATKAQLNGKSDTTHTHKDKLNLNTFTMVGLGFTKDSTVSTVDFFKALYKKYGQYRGDLTVTYANASRAYISTDGTTTNRIPINGGIMHCFFGNPDTTWSGHLITYTCMENNETYIIEGVRDNTETGWSKNCIEKVTRGSETQGYIKNLTINGKTITYTRGNGTTGTLTTQDTNTTYSAMTGASSSADGKSGLVPTPTKGNQGKYLRADGTWQVPPDTNTVYTHPTTSGHKHIPSGGSSGQILRWSSDGTAVWGADNNTTYSVATTSTNGLMSSGDKSKLDGIASGANKIVVDTALNSTSTNPVQNKVVNSALSNKVDKVSGKGLSTNDYTTDEKTRLGSLITYTIATANQTLSKTTAGYIKFIYASGANRTVTYPNVNGTSTTITIPNGLVEIFCSTPNGYAPARVSQTYVS